MCARTRLDTNQAGRQRREELHHLCSAHTLADHHNAIDIKTVNLKHMRPYTLVPCRRRQAAGGVPTSFLKARLKAASDP